MSSTVEQLQAENARLREALLRSVTLMHRANQLASIGVLTAGLAHEIRNPLVVLRAFAQLLPERWEDAEFRLEFAHVAVAEADRAEALVRELLHAAHESAREPSDGRGTPIGDADGCRADHAHDAPRATLGDTVDAVLPLLRMHARRKSAEVVFEAGDPIDVSAEPQRLRQVVMNLVLNAIEATPEGGMVAVVCGRQGTRATLSVRDSGRGVAAADLPHIFEPFFTTRQDGTGLGLAITREIVDAYGGTIRVESAPGRGATFIVELPAIGAVDAAAAAAPA